MSTLFQDTLQRCEDRIAESGATLNRLQDVFANSVPGTPSHLATFDLYEVCTHILAHFTPRLLL